jgi:CubicO group peptidase (beta-lactamase class C family)
MHRSLNRLPLLLLLGLPRLAAAQDSVAISPADLVSRLGATLDTLAAKERFSGVVLVAQNGAAVFHRAYGYADREARRPNELGTAFNLSSINKIFTIAAVQQLAAAGKLDLDSTLARYWPDYPNADVARRVTIRQLLEHRSGIGGNIFPRNDAERRRLRHNRDFLPMFVSEPLRFEPGTRQQYSNAGYVILGMLIERVSGEDYYAYVRRHLYQPAGMEHTGHFSDDSLPPFAAIGYTREIDGSEDAPPTAPLHRNTASKPMRGSAAGGGYSTTGDLLRWLQARRAGSIEGLTGPGPRGAAGGSPGSNTMLVQALPGGYDIVVLSNFDTPAAENVVDRVEAWLGGKASGE